MDIEYSEMIRWIRHHELDSLPRLLDSLSPGQIRSKRWCVDELVNSRLLYKDNPIRIEIIGSWFGWPLVQYLSENFWIKRIRLYDIDPVACRIARKYSELFNIEIETFEMSYWNHTQDKIGCDLLINTSSEHMEETLTEKHNYTYPPVIVLQNNNMYHEPDHVNCVDDPYELALMNGIERIAYAGSLPLYDEYSRYMVIGR